jgi:hypothetical protein
LLDAHIAALERRDNLRMSNSIAPISGRLHIPFLDTLSFTSGLVLGEAVTVALRYVPSWNKPVLGADGQPVPSVPGATRIGNAPIRERHKEVVGPLITEFASKLSNGFMKDMLEAFGRGATDAPGATYRKETK